MKTETARLKKLTLQMMVLATLGAVALQAAPTTQPAATRPAATQAVVIQPITSQTASTQSASTTQPVLSPAAAALQAKVMDVAPRCVALTVGLVSISSENGMMGIASGSGVMISADGLILTAGHVIQKPGTPLTIRFTDGQVFKGVALGIDHAADTGLVRITDPAPAGGWKFAEMAPDQSINMGDWVLATGNPGSIVIGRNPPLRLGRVTGHDARLLKTNCALEPGDSGGPVWDLSGRVVGINSRIMTNGSADMHLKEYLSIHVPVSLFTAQWTDLLAGMNAHPEVNLDSGRNRNRRTPVNPRLRDALSKLAAAKDPEAMQLLADSVKNGGRMPISPEQAQKLIARADALSPATQPTTRKSELAGAATVPATLPSGPALGAASPATQPAKPAIADAATQPADTADRLQHAIKKLIAAHDPEVIKLIAGSDVGKMQLTPQQVKDLIARADALPANAAPATQPAVADAAGDPTTRPGDPAAGAFLGSAIQKLLNAHDPEMVKLIEDSKKNGNSLTLSKAKAAELIARAQAMPATQPAAAQALSPATQPTTRQLANNDSPSTRPATPAVAERGIPQALRATVGPRLKQSLLQQFPGAKITDEILNRIMDKSSYDRGRLNVTPDIDDLRAMGVSPETIAARAGGLIQSSRSAAEVGKTSLQTLSFFAPALDAAGDCMVEIRANDKQVLLGTIVSADGYIVTKASDLPDHPSIILPDGRSLTAHLVGKDAATDLALLKISARNLTAVKFTSDAPLGAWLVSPTSDPNTPAVGVVSDVARPIPQVFPHFAGEQKIILGVGFAGPDRILGMVAKDMPAETAGLKVGDEILSLNGQPVTDSAQFTALMKKTKSGDRLTIKVRRDGKEMEFNPVLGQMKATTQTSNSIGEADNVAGGKLSTRRTNFPSAIETDAAIWADECGGPLINLQGQTIGINIARYDRVCTFALPADVVQSTITKLKAATK